MSQPLRASNFPGLVASSCAAACGPGAGAMPGSAGNMWRAGGSGSWSIEHGNIGDLGDLRISKV